MAPYSSTLAWKIPWAEEPGRLQSMGSPSRTRLNDFTFTFHFHAVEKEMATHSSVLAWRIPGTGEPGGLPSMGLHRVGHDWSDLAVAVAVLRKIKKTCKWTKAASVGRSFFFQQNSPLSGIWGHRACQKIPLPHALKQRWCNLETWIFQSNFSSQRKAD